MPSKQPANRSVSEFPLPGKHPPEDFQGFPKPNYTQLPNEILDRWLPALTGAEVKVLLYIARRTFGFHEQQAKIGLRRICSGIPGKDSGTGLHLETALAAVRGLEKKGALLCNGGAGPRNGVRSTYSIKLMETAADRTENPNGSRTENPNGSPYGKSEHVKERSPERKRKKGEESAGRQVGRSVLLSEPKKTDRPTDNSLNLVKEAIQESGICAKLNDTPSRPLLQRIAAKLNGNSPDALKVRIRLRFDAISGLGMLEGLAGDVAAAQSMQPSEIQRARRILEHPTKHNEADKLWARVVLQEASEQPTPGSKTDAVMALAMRNLKRTGRIFA
jgi:hypothetical protein